MKKIALVLLTLFVASAIQAREEEGARRWSCPGNDKKYSSMEKAEKNCPGQRLQEWEKQTQSDTESGLMHGGGILGTGLAKSKKTTYVPVNQRR